MSKVYIKDIRERDVVESPFMVRDKIMAMAKNGKPYMTLKLVDRSGEVEGRVWDRVDEFSALFTKGDVIRARGKASVYMGKMQLVIQDLNRLEDGQFDLGDFLPTAERPIEEMQLELRDRVDSLTDPYLRSLMESFLEDGQFLKAFSSAPAAKSMHHVYIGGLLEHSLAVAALAHDICRRYPNINRDLLLVGALLHDVGKITELSYSRVFDYTDEGKLLGHIVIGVELVEERMRAIEGFPRMLATLLKHLLLSHHGQYEYGSPKRPKTLEAVILNFLDDLDSKINGVRTHLDKEPDNSESWSSYHRLYDRYFFKDSLLQEVSAPQAAQPLEEPPPPPVQKREREKPVSRRQERGGKFSFTLEEQLKGKSLDLFGADDERE